MPSTAWTTPSSVENSTTRSRIERSGSGTDAALGGIEGVAEPVTDEVDAENDEHDQKARIRDEPPLVEPCLLTLVEQGAECRRGRADAEAEERERRLERDRGSDRERRRHHDRPDRVRDHVAKHDPEVARPGSARGLDIFLLAQGQEDTAHDARDTGPDQTGDEDRERRRRAAVEELRRGQQDREQG